ncbi:D-allulose 6-phosphate 3-epimerase [Bifidobacterium sp.]|uniref:D-allulose 6-phosphate 3-epimerase n=1 Tax=Bifidobacterium sp. TaxID=41200 RepID=UPI0025B90310|nr:D-allulose 6-phosphate 3-epimerase [Bifidobacterium sp.]MCH4160611.1 ribulose-phosphate 3-epimerase [Bifidobacterium sp.]MCH4175309.1 ribulose-phosphate 3-epimerase [Bifidobacterium sp.]MCI1635586.1 D-allulose 6-phosphate 3-epimerase [Bifidobacterium sp.]
MSRKIQLSPSLMTMDLDQFKEQITFLNDKVNSYHIDIMDGHFVPNITLSPWFVEQVRKISDVPMSAHMMVTDAPFWVKQLINVNCDEICFPSEVANGVAFSMIDEIHQAGLKAGAVLNPETSIDTIMPYIDVLDKVTIMTIDPGFAGQRFLQSCLQKITQLRDLREEHGYSYQIEMDGSTNLKHWKMISDANPDIYVIGRSGLFGLTDNIEDSWKQMVQEYESSTGYRFDNGL